MKNNINYLMDKKIIFIFTDSKVKILLLLWYKQIYKIIQNIYNFFLEGKIIKIFFLKGCIFILLYIKEYKFVYI